MDFAKKLLNKYGWKEGQGLGKNNDGIEKPLKASLKFDNAGLGADQAASDFNNHWWERVFNEAAENVQVKTAQNGAVCMDLKNDADDLEISTKGYSLKKLRKAKENTGDLRYTNFLQSATLTNAGDEVENPHKIAVTDIETKQYKALTDEELFRACGGRTAHKGARHGLNLSGKLQRLEQQEQEMLAKMLGKSQEVPDVSSSNIMSESKSKKKKTKEKAAAAHLIAVSNEDAPYGSSDVQEDSSNQVTTKKRSKKRSIPEEEVVVEVEVVEATEPKHKKSKKCKKSSHELQAADSAESRHKKKKKKSKVLEIETNVPEQEVQTKKSKKKKKDKSSQNCAENE